MTYNRRVKRLRAGWDGICALKASPANGNAGLTISRCSVSGSRSHTLRHPSSPAVASPSMSLRWLSSKARSHTLK